MALRAVIEHPKFIRLKLELGIPKYQALGLLESLWHFTGRYTPCGDIGRYEDGDIEAWLEWDGEPGVLIAALIKSHWLDKDKTHRLVVHDWSTHADKATKMALKRGGLEPVVHTACQLVDNKCAQRADISPPPVPVPVPVPEPDKKLSGNSKTREEPLGKVSLSLSSETGMVATDSGEVPLAVARSELKVLGKMAMPSVPDDDPKRTELKRQLLRAQRIGDKGKIADLQVQLRGIGC